MIHSASCCMVRVKAYLYMDTEGFTALTKQLKMKRSLQVDNRRQEIGARPTSTLATRYDTTQCYERIGHLQLSSLVV